MSKKNKTSLLEGKLVKLTFYPAPGYEKAKKPKFYGLMMELVPDPNYKRPEERCPFHDVTNCPECH